MRRFYADAFPDSSVGVFLRAPGEFPSGKAGAMFTVEFTVMGVPCLGLNGGPELTHSESFWFYAAPTDQAETDRYFAMRTSAMAANKAYTPGSRTRGEWPSK